MNNNDELYSFDEKPKRKRHEDPTTWADAFKAIGIFLGLILVYALVGDIFHRMFFGDKLDTYLEIMSSTVENNPLMGNMDMFQSPVFIISSIIATIVFLVIGVFTVYGLTHVFATKLFKGEGTLRGLIVRANIWTIGTYFAVAIASYIQNLLMMNSIVEQFEGVNISASYATLQQYNDALMSLMLPMYLIYGIAWLVWGVAISKIVARNYAIDTSKGCASLIVMNISIFALICGCSFAIVTGSWMVIS